MSTFTPNLQYEQVARGGDVGTWDTPTNSNWAISDLVVGGIAVIPVNNSNIVLTAAQFQCRNLTFNSTLTGSITVTLSASFTKSYEIRNLATGSSAFTITLETTGGGNVICCPPGQTIDIFNDGINVGFKNLPPVGTYIDWAVSATPAWVSGCTIPPYLPCVGGTFSGSVYPALAALLGGTTLPDRRGTVGANLDQGAGRLTAGTSIGVTGSQTVQILQTHLPSATLAVTITDPGHTHPMEDGLIVQGAAGATAALVPIGAGTGSVGMGPAFTGVTATAALGGSNTLFPVVQPTTIIGLSFIRAG